MNREQIMTAFCNQIFAMADFRTTGRRVLFWTEVPQQPACFVRNVKDEYIRQGGLPPKTTLHVEVWLYTKGGNPDAAPGPALNNLLDALDATLRPTGADAMMGRQTLGLGQNVVSHVWIEGETLYDPGDLDSQAKAMVPIRILVPT